MSRIYNLSQGLYNRVLREKLPKKVGAYGGVPVPLPLFDRHTTSPRWEERLRTATEDVLEAGDHIVIVGGGVGTTAVHAANVVGRGGSVTVFEANGDNARSVELAAEWSDVADLVTVKNAVVGPPIDIWGPYDEAARLDGSDLPQCNVLQLDAEGSELAVLDDLTIRPRAIVVEYHPFADVEYDDIRIRLEKLGYDSRLLHEPADGSMGFAVGVTNETRDGR